MKLTGLLVLLFLLATPVAGIAESEPLKTAPAPDSALSDREITHRFLLNPDEKPVLKRHTLELAPFVGPILGPAFPPSIFYGMRTGFFFTERFSVGVDGGFSQTGIDPFTLLTVVDEGDQNSYFINGSMALHMPTAIGVSKTKLVQTDLFVQGGAGVFVFNNDKDVIEPTYMLGGGTKVYFNRYLVLRIDVRNYFIRVGPSWDKSLTSNAMIQFGLSFFIPPRQGSSI